MRQWGEAYTFKRKQGCISKDSDPIQFSDWKKPLLILLTGFFALLAQELKGQDGQWQTLSDFSLNQAQMPDWSQDYRVPPDGRPNPYSFEDEELFRFKEAGQIHAQIYPVTVTGMIVPVRPIKKFVEDDSRNPFKRLFQEFFRDFSRVEKYNDLFRWIGLNPYPEETDEGVYSVPFPGGERPEYLIGYGEQDRFGAKGFTISCAECHSSRLFGKTVLGMTNRFPRANLTFLKAKQAMPFLNIRAFKWYHRATAGEAQMMKFTKANLNSVGVKEPLTLGLDTSLAQVALSLNRRKPDPYATKSKHFEYNPRADELDHTPADSKPAVWWNVKYKNKFLSDGSIVSGNPIYTNLLWNELGRGTDLRALSAWLKDNPNVIAELTTAVFSSEAPRITDFFPAEKIDLELAKSGQKIYEQTCSKCHGHYDKTWDLPQAHLFSRQDQLKTWRVRYPEDTPTKDVGTDPYRRLGMRSLLKLNDLAISKEIGTRVQVQGGYVPPPLVGIWARWPYFHNNSIPNLCALLTPATGRPVVYYAGPAEDPNRDFDFDCNGYPTGKRTPSEWRKREFRYYTRNRGMSNSGHDKMLLNEDGTEKFSTEQKQALIQFLQTL